VAADQRLTRCQAHRLLKRYRDGGAPGVRTGGLVGRRITSFDVSPQLAIHFKEYDSQILLPSK
jgi:hypothetical protein